MTSAIKIPDYVTVTTPLTIGELARLTADLLAANSDLPMPSAIRLATTEEQVEMQFTASQATFEALALWADRTAATITGTPGSDKDGPYVCCQVRFTYRTARLRAFAHVRAANTCPSCGVDWDKFGDCEHVG